jgi:hypothetical protein
MRNLSTVAVQAINAQETGEVFLILLTISSDEIVDTYRFVRNTEDITSNGYNYIAYGFDITLPDEDPDTLPTIQLVIDNVDRAIVDTLNSLIEPPTVTLSVVLASTPNVIEYGPLEMTLLGADYDSLTITGQLAYEDILNQSYPSGKYIPSDYPGLF